LIEAAITPDTTAILATHVYGIPCDVEAIDIIAKKHGLKVIYDAAHAFDVEVQGQEHLGATAMPAPSVSTPPSCSTRWRAVPVVLHDEADRCTDLRLLRSFGHIGDEHFSLGMSMRR
jgi:dTDP-4-amino-4,6-dideoxygalactose transaminase